MNRISLVAASLLVLAACPAPPPPHRPDPPVLPPKGPPPPVVKKLSLAEVGLDAAALDKTADPCGDFYQFACGGWVKATNIPDDQPRWNRSFSEINLQNETDLKEILEGLAATPSSDAGQKKTGDFFAACMDEPAIEKAGTKALDELVKLAKGAKKAKLAQVVARLHDAGVGGLFGAFSGPDDKDARRNILHVDQGGLGLPDRDYYLKDDDKTVAIRDFYQGHVERMLVLVGEKRGVAKKAAVKILELETAIAKISKTRVERRDPDGMYNKIDRQGLVDKGKKLDWAAYLAERQLAGITDINVTSVPFVEGLESVIDGADDQTLSHYLEWHVAHAYATALPKAFVDENFALTNKVTGQPTLRPRWKRCVAAADGALGELLAQAFVKKRFSAGSKEAVKMMVGAIRDAFRDNLAKLPWMDDATRKLALGKLEGMEYLIGYPDKWKSYDFEVSRADHAANVVAATRFELRRELLKAGKPVDRQEWFMTPPTVNAYYHPNMNHMVFPAGILQPPFYSPTASLPVNMGGMGMVVGHELTHGFDDQGSKFNREGNLQSWWPLAVRKQFDERTTCVAEQYAGYEVLPGVPLDGKLTLGENIADNGGLKLAFAAYRALRLGAKEVVEADGFTEDQQFFLSLGQIWCSKYREEFARLRAKTDTHSQPNWRVNGSVRNLPEFGEAFHCPAGSKLRPKNACGVW